MGMWTVLDALDTYGFTKPSFWHGWQCVSKGIGNAAHAVLSR